MTLTPEEINARIPGLMLSQRQLILDLLHKREQAWRERVEGLPRRIETNDPAHPAHRLVIEGQDTRWMVAYVCATCKGKLLYAYGSTFEEAIENAKPKIEEVLSLLSENITDK